RRILQARARAGHPRDLGRARAQAGQVAASRRVLRASGEMAARHRLPAPLAAARVEEPLRRGTARPLLRGGRPAEQGVRPGGGARMSPEILEKAAAVPREGDENVAMNRSELGERKIELTATP